MTSEKGNTQQLIYAHAYWTDELWSQTNSYVSLAWFPLFISHHRKCLYWL